MSLEQVRILLSWVRQRKPWRVDVKDPNPMKKSVLFIISILSFSAFSALAAEEVTIQMSPSSSKAFAKLYFPEANAESCEATVVRPGRAEEAQASEKNVVRCGEGNELRMGEALVDAWGSIGATQSFSVRGSFADEMLKRFMNETARLPEEVPADSIWSVISICGPQAVDCHESHFLNESPTADSAAQIACARNTQLMKPSTYVQGESRGPRRDQQAQIEHELKNGERKIVQTSCTFL